MVAEDLLDRAAVKLGTKQVAGPTHRIPEVTVDKLNGSVLPQILKSTAAHEPAHSGNCGGKQALPRGIWRQAYLSDDLPYLRECAVWPEKQFAHDVAVVVSLAVYQHAKVCARASVSSERSAALVWVRLTAPRWFKAVVVRVCAAAARRLPLRLVPLALRMAQLVLQLLDLRIRSHSCSSSAERSRSCWRKVSF